MQDCVAPGRLGKATTSLCADADICPNQAPILTLSQPFLKMRTRVIDAKNTIAPLVSNILI
jgi:hypothetical protein